MTLDLTSELDLARAELTGHHEGPIERIMTAELGVSGYPIGCFYGFSLAPSSLAAGLDRLDVEIHLGASENCYGGGIPGRGSRVAFDVKSNGPGIATLSIQHLDLVPE